VIISAGNLNILGPVELKEERNTDAKLAK